MRRVANVLGVPVDDVTIAETLDRLMGYVEVGRRTGAVHQVTTVNVDFVTNALRDPDLMTVLRCAALSLPDGMPIVVGSRLLGTPLRARVAGADLVSALAERAAQEGYSMYLFGAAPGIAGRAASTLRERYQGLMVTGDAGPSVAPDGAMDLDALEPIVLARPDIVCVALGNPKQEHWIRRHGARVGAPVFVGIGGSLDLIVEDKRRAPVWMQRGGLEWLFRAAQEPRRLARRYAVDALIFTPRFVRQAWVGRPKRRGRNAIVLSDGSPPVLTLIGSPTFEDVPVGGASAELLGRVDVVDASQWVGPDNRSAALLLSFASASASRGSRLSVRSAGDPIKRRLASLGIASFVEFESG